MFRRFSRYLEILRRITLLERRMMADFTKLNASIEALAAAVHAIPKNVDDQPAVDAAQVQVDLLTASIVAP